MNCYKGLYCEDSGEEEYIDNKYHRGTRPHLEMIKCYWDVEERLSQRRKSMAGLCQDPGAL